MILNQNINEHNTYIEPNLEEGKVLSFSYDNSYNLNDCSFDSLSLNSSEKDYLYYLNMKKLDISHDSSNLIKIEDKKLIKFRTESYPLSKQLNKKIKREALLENSNLKEGKNSNRFKKPKKKKHTAESNDNILRKIQVMYIKFIISYTNDIIRSLINEKNVPKFNDLNYEKKKIVNHKFVESLKSSTLEEIVKFKKTPKIKKKEENINEQIYDSVLKKCPIIKNFFERTYLSLFKEYYENQNNIFTFNGKDIPLSDKTKSRTFDKLIEKNLRYKEKIKYVSINYYLNSYKRLKKPNFKIHTCKKSNQNKEIK